MSHLAEILLVDLEPIEIPASPSKLWQKQCWWGFTEADRACSITRLPVTPLVHPSINLYQEECLSVV